MGVEVRTEGKLVSVRLYGRIEATYSGPNWADSIRKAAETDGEPVLLLCTLESGLDLPVQILAAGARQMLSVLPLVRAAAMVAPGENERTMLRVSVLAVRPPHPAELFADEESARAWLMEKA